MKTKYLFFSFLGIVFGITLLIYPLYYRDRNSIETVESLIDELNNNINSLPKSVHKIDEASGKVQIALDRLPEKVIKAIRQSPAGMHDSLPEPPFQEINSENANLIAVTTQFTAAVVQMQAAYEIKISRLEKEISEIKMKNSPLNIELFLGCFSILSGISVIILAWRKDSREIAALKIEREKLLNQKGI